MSEPTGNERTIPPKAMPQDTASSADEHTAGLPASSSSDHDFSFLEKPESKDELGRLGSFRILKELGRGGMGCVLLAEDTGLERQVALKVMLPRFAQDEKAKARFLREARAAGKLQHDHVVSIHQVGEANGVPFIAMEFLKGMPLDKYLKEKGDLPLPIVQKIGREIGLGLDAAHKLGMIHRDIKPANVWLESLPAGPGRKAGSFRVKILDFGLARREEDGEAHLTQSGAIVGTPAYMAPEQASGEKLDARADLFSLGVLLYRLATGMPAFTGPTTVAMLMQVASHEPPAASDVKPGVSVEMARIIAKLMAKKRDARYGSAAEFLADWERLMKVPKAAAPTQTLALERRSEPERPATGKAIATQRINPPASTQPATSLGARVRLPRWMLLAGASGVLAIAIAAGFFLLRTPSGDGGNPSPAVDSAKEPPPLDATNAVAVQAAWSAKLKLPVEKENTIGMKLRLIPPAESPFGQPYYLGKYEVTREEWDKVMGGNLAGVDKGQNPIETISWYDCVEFCNKLSELEGLKPHYEMTVKSRKSQSIDDAEVTVLGGNGYHIPTEMEWEHGCRAGTTTKYAFGDNSDDLGEFGWYQGNSDGRAHPVGKKKPNGFGLYDMHGNVAEWVEEAVKNTGGATKHIVRGGTFAGPAAASEVRFRTQAPAGYRNYAYGLRVARVPTEALPVAKEPPPLNETNAAEVQGAWAAKLKLPVEKENTIGMKLRLIPPGQGVKDAYYVGKYEVTQAEWQKVMGYNPSASTKLPNCPVENVNWFDCIEFCNKLSERDGLPAAYRMTVKLRKGPSIEEADVEILGGPGYRIPTDPEWEQACRAGTKGKYCFGDNDAELEEYAWYDQNSGKKTQPVGELKPNGFGLYDIHGNVREWNEEMLITATSKAPERVHRGGAWSNGAGYCAAVNRTRNEPANRNNNYGLRLARVPSGDAKVAAVPAAVEPLPLDASNAREVQSTWAAKLKVDVETKSPSGIVMVLIPPGGAALPKPYLMGKYEVTQAEWESVMGYNPSTFKKGNTAVEGHDTSRFPVENVSWYDSVEFCNKLSEKEGLKPYYELKVTKRASDKQRIDEAEVTILRGTGYHLPMEAEWEHACRAGSKTKYHFGDKEEGLPEYAWFDKNSGNLTHRVGELKPNAFGLYDMHGNVREWNEEMLTSNTASGAPERVIRGGHWNFTSGQCVVASRSTPAPTARTNHSGLRLARTPAEASRAVGGAPLAFTTPAFEPWVKATASLTGKEQIEAINAKLKELNPKFTGSVGGHKQVNKNWYGVGEQDVVERLVFSTLDNLRDLSPVRACSELQEINGSSTRINTATLSDLAPLAGMKLTKLDLWNTLVADLTPLEGMPLTELNVGASEVADLTPLKRMKLTKLIIASTRVSDLSPLAGMPLIHLECGQGTWITDLTPLKGMPLTDLGVGGLRIQKGLEVLKEMPLQKLAINPGYNIDFLRAKPTLTTINNRPAAEYWK